MASNINMAMRRLATSQMRQLAPRTKSQPICLRLQRAYSNPTAPPPLLVKLKEDLKKAMREKDAPRLTVVRTILAAITNAAKTDKPIQTDLGLVQLMKKARRGNEEAMEEARKANREDLVNKESIQLQILDDYMAGSGIKFVQEDELKEIVEKVIAEKEGKKGDVLNALMQRNWEAEGKYVDRGAVARMANELLRQKD